MSDEFDLNFLVHLIQLFCNVGLLLQQHPKGAEILAEYEKFHTISAEMRHALVKISVAQLVKECGPLVNYIVIVFVINYVTIVFVIN